jgi:predicted TIM-barrel fold metal-dependent hydrolase
MRALFVVLMLMFGSQAGAAGFFVDPDISADDLSKISVTVFIDDNAKGACWTNLREVREYAEEKFRFKRVKVVPYGKQFDPDSSAYMFQISVAAYRNFANNAGPCVGHLFFKLSGWSLLHGVKHNIEMGYHLSKVHAESKNFNQQVLIYLENIFRQFPN